MLARTRLQPLQPQSAKVKTRLQSPTFYRKFTLKINYIEGIALQLNQDLHQIKQI